MSVTAMATVGRSRERSGLFATIRADVSCVLQRDPAARNPVEVALLYPGVHALLIHRVANGLWRRGLKFPARFLSWFGRLVTNIDIHPGATIGERLFIDHGAGVVVGETAVIENDVTLYHGVTLGGTSWSPGKRHPTIENGALIGAGAKILGPITIGARARIGANSVVIEDVAPEMTVVGIPGRIVRVERRRSGHDGRIDLEHHLIPDPVGDAISVLIDRIDFLEARLAHLQARRSEAVSRSSGRETKP